MTTAPAENAAQPRVRTNPLAVAALALSLLWFVGIGSLLGIILAKVARKQIDRESGAQGGLGLATAAIIVGWFGILAALGVLYWYLLPDAPPSTG